MSQGPAPVVIVPYDASWPAQFRALRAALQAYATLKRELATRFGTEREGYTDAKSAFIAELLTRARA